MQNINIFNFNDNQVRTSTQNNEVFFCLKDVCKVLGIIKPENVIPRLNLKGTRKIGTLTKGGKQSMVYINESNVYKVVFKSNKLQVKF